MILMLIMMMVMWRSIAWKTMVQLGTQLWSKTLASR